MALGNRIASLLRRSSAHPGWSFVLQGNLDLKRHTVFVFIENQELAETTALQAVEAAAVVVEREALPLSVLNDLQLRPGEHMLCTGDHGWSFLIQPPHSEKRLVVVHLANEPSAEVAALRVIEGNILDRSKVPASVISDLRLTPGQAVVV